MKEFKANRLSGGNRIFPSEIKIDNFGVNLKIPGVFSNEEKSISFYEISSIHVDSPLIGFSTIVIKTRHGNDNIEAHGFEKAHALEIKEIIQKGITGRGFQSIENTYKEDMSLEDCIQKLETLNKEERTKIIWQWIKQNNINLNQFKILIDYINV